jgi:hypothetical protein
MASSQECEIERDPRRTGVVATGVEMIIEIVKSDADDPLQGQRKDIKCRLLLSTRPVTADRGEHNHHWDNPPSVVLNG